MFEIDGEKMWRSTMPPNKDLTLASAIATVRGRSTGRTRYEGQPPYADELLVKEIDELRKAALDAEQMAIDLGVDDFLTKHAAVIKRAKEPIKAS